MPLMNTAECCRSRIDSLFDSLARTRWNTLGRSVAQTRQLRYSLGFVQIHGLYGLRIWPTFEQPRLDGPGRRLDLQVGSTKRALGSVGCEDDVVLPPTRRSIEHSVTSHSNGANHSLTCSGFVNTSKTSAIGASNSRVITTSRSFGLSITARPYGFRGTVTLLVVVAL